MLGRTLPRSYIIRPYFLFSWEGLELTVIPLPFGCWNYTLEILLLYPWYTTDGEVLLGNTDAGWTSLQHWEFEYFKWLCNSNYSDCHLLESRHFVRSCSVLISFKSLGGGCFWLCPGPWLGGWHFLRLNRFSQPQNCGSHLNWNWNQGAPSCSSYFCCFVLPIFITFFSVCGGDFLRQGFSV